MRKGLLAVMTAGLLAVGGGAFVASSSAFGYTICNGVHDHETLQGPVVVPKGAFCYLKDFTTVNGNVQVQSGGTLVIDSSQINGSVQSNAPGSNASDPLSLGISPFSIEICESTTEGPVQISNAQAAVVIGGPNCPGSGNVLNEAGSSGSTGVSLTANNGPTYLDDQRGFCGPCIQGSVSVSGNKRLTDITDNDIGGSLNCTANNPPPTGGGNTAANKTAQCSGL